VPSPSGATASFFYVPIAERTLTIAVLLIAIVQIIVSRPHVPTEAELEAVDG